MFRKSMYGEPLSSFQILTPDNFPLDKLCATFSIYDEFSNRHYFNTYSGFSELPEDISIPNGSISGSISLDGRKISNIQYEGVADQLRATWVYDPQTSNSDSLMMWSVFVNHDQESITLPPLPGEIIDALQGNTHKLVARDIEYYNFNTTTSHADIINRYYINNTPYTQWYDEYFRLGTQFEIAKKKGNEKLVNDPYHDWK